MKLTTKNQLTQDIQALNDSLKNDLQPLQKIIESITTEATTVAHAADETQKQMKNISLLVPPRDKNKIKSLSETLDKYREAADNLKILKNYYVSKIESRLHLLNYRLANLIYKYNINNTRDINIFKNLVAFAVGDYSAPVYNSHLLFYSSITIEQYNQEITTAIKSDYKYTHCEPLTRSNIYQYFTTSRGEFLETFPESTADKIAEQIEKYKTLSAYEPNPRAVLNNIKDLKKLLHRHEEERAALFLTQKNEIKELNALTLYIEDGKIKG